MAEDNAAKAKAAFDRIRGLTVSEATVAQTLQVAGSVIADAIAETQDRTGTGGIFNANPRATPKYAQGAPRTDGYRNTMARLYILMTDTNKTIIKNSLTEINMEKVADSVIRGDKDSAKGYIEFLLQSATHQHQEKVEVIDTLADKYAAYAYGSSAPTYRYSVALLNSKQDDQAANMFRAYWTLLRAMSLANMRTTVYFEYDRMIVQGVMTSLSWTLNGMDESVCMGNFDILVKRLLFVPEINAYEPWDVAGGVVRTTITSGTTNNTLEVRS